jgi:hypothetical protein
VVLNKRLQEWSANETMACWWHPINLRVKSRTYARTGQRRAAQKHWIPVLTDGSPAQAKTDIIAVFCMESWIH